MKINKLVVARFEDYLFENLKCKPVSSKTVAHQSTTNSIQFAKGNPNNSHLLIWTTAVHFCISST